MMEFITFYSFFLLVILSPLSFFASAFSGEFEIRELEVEAPFQADPKSIDNTTLSCTCFNSPSMKQSQRSDPLLDYTSYLP
jgi:hypothetical protein